MKEGCRPSECETDKAGYLVEYEDGYQSWSPKEVFDKAYKPSETFLERLHIEHDELKSRFEGLSRFLTMGAEKVVEVVGPVQAGMLVSQRVFMDSYLNILECRIQDIEEDMEKDK